MSQEHLGPYYWIAEETAVDDWRPTRQRPRTPSITDGIEDLLDLLEPAKRRGMIAWLSVGYYDGWRPGRQEIGDLVALELGLLTIDNYIQRKQERRSAAAVTDIMPLMRQRLHRSARR